MRNEKDISILKELAEKVRICVFTTIGTDEAFNSRPMGLAKIEEDGSLWFFTNEYSMKSKEISKENKVTLGFSDPSSNTYIFINGEAELSDDQQKKKEYFNPAVKAWFPDGVDDPNLILIKVTPEAAEYWDSSASKMVVAFQMLKAIVTGEKADMGDHDTLKF